MSFFSGGHQSAYLETIPPFFQSGFSLFFLWRLQDFLFLDLPLWGLAGIKPPLAYTKVIASGCSSAFSFRYGYVRLVILPCSSSDRALTLWLQHHFPFLSSKGGGGKDSLSLYSFWGSSTPVFLLFHSSLFSPVLIITGTLPSSSLLSVQVLEDFFGFSGSFFSRRSIGPIFYLRPFRSFCPLTSGVLTFVS